MPNRVLELVSFQLVANADEETFLKASQAVDTFCRTQPGFISRRLAKSEEGGWVDCIEWLDMECAQSAAKAMPKADGVGPVLSAIDMPTVSLRHLDVMTSHQAD